jgi:hypothetical protein
MSAVAGDEVAPRYGTRTCQELALYGENWLRAKISDLVSSVPDPTTRSEQHKNQRRAECNDEEIEIHGADSIMNRK